MKLLLSALLVMSSFSCAHQQNVTQATPPTNSRLPAFASVADSDDLTRLSDSELLGYAGKNILRASIACPLTSLGIILAAVTETIPILSAVGETSTELGSGLDYNSHQKTPVTNYVGGSAGAVVVDLTKAGYGLIFNDSEQKTQNIFYNTKQSYQATKYLAQKITTANGNCGLANRRLLDVLNEIQRRQAVYASQRK